MTTHRYDPRTLAPDFARAGAGLGVSLGVLAWFEPAAWLGPPLAALAALFAAFAWRTLRQQFTAVEIDGNYVRWRAFGRHCIAWKDLRLVTLRHYSTRRDRGQGWMQLTLGGGGRRISIDSNIGGFPELLARVLAEAHAAGVPVARHTLANAAALIGGGAGRRLGGAP
jgi:hypothetical protein